MRPLGVRPVIIGKTHMKPDLQGMEWLGIPKDSIIGVRLSECGFDPYERDDGLHPIGKNRDGGEAYEAICAKKAIQGMPHGTVMPIPPLGMTERYYQVGC